MVRVPEAMAAALEKVPDADLMDIYNAIKEGAKTPADVFGFTPEALNTVESMALAYYRARHYGQAAQLYGFILQMNPKRATAWRGLGACSHGRKEYALARTCYLLAVQYDDTDLISKVFLGETLCLIGEREAGVKYLEEVIAKGATDPACRPYLTRARAVVNAKGGMPPRFIMLEEGKKVVDQAQALMAKEAAEWDNAEVSKATIRSHPRLAKKLKAVNALLASGGLTLAQVGGFTDNELDGAFGCACQYATMGKFGDAMMITGFLAFVDPYKSRYHQLTGICWQRLKHYVSAKRAYEIALVMDPNDVVTMAYLGECQLLLGQKAGGVETLQKVIKLAAGKPQLEETARRSQTLLGRLKK
jgi:tetratricopeptide (TPR) repeat protein